MWLSPAASWGQPFCRSVSYTISCQIPDFPSSHRISVLHQPLIKPCATARVWRARNCLKRSTRCLRFHSQSHGQYIVFISLTCVCLFPKRIWSSNRMMCVTRHFTRGRALGSPHRRATCEKASKTVRKERTWPPPPPHRVDRGKGSGGESLRTVHASGAPEMALVMKIGDVCEGPALGWLSQEAFLCSEFKTSFLKKLCMCQLLSHVWLFVNPWTEEPGGLNPWTTACQAPLSMEFSRQEYCSG